MNTSLRFYCTHKEGARCCNWFRAEAEKHTHLRRRDIGVNVQREAEGRGPACPRDGTGWAHRDSGRLCALAAARRLRISAVVPTESELSGACPLDKAKLFTEARLVLEAG